jgi:hypothetical protein
MKFRMRIYKIIDNGVGKLFKLCSIYEQHKYESARVKLTITKDSPLINSFKVDDILIMTIEKEEKE